MISRANPLCIVYLDNHSTLSAISILNTLFYAQTYKDAYIALYLYKDHKNSDIVNILSNKISLEFEEFIKNNKLTINTTNQSLDMLDIYRDPKNIKYNIYIPINVNYIYSKNYISNIVNYVLKNKDLDCIKITSNETIDSYGKIHNKNISKSDFIFTKNGLVNSKDIKYKDVLSNLENFNYITLIDNSYIQNMIGSNDKIILNEETFKVIWLEENTDYDKNQLFLNSSYVFVYFQNNKVFNINNNIHGIIKTNTDFNFSVDWFGGDTGFQQYQYEFDNKRNIFVNVDI